MARKIIQIASDNCTDPSCGTYWGILALCDDGTIWGGQVKGDVEWRELNAPEKEEAVKTSGNTQSAAIAQIADDIGEWAKNDGVARVNPSVFRGWVQQLRAL